jgi:hypothetical protein
MRGIGEKGKCSGTHEQTASGAVERDRDNTNKDGGPKVWTGVVTVP